MSNCSGFIILKTKHYILLSWIVFSMNTQNLKTPLLDKGIVRVTMETDIA